MARTRARRWRWPASVLLALASVLVCISLLQRPGAGVNSPPSRSLNVATRAQPLDWLTIGGGATPSSNQYGIEADVADALRTFAGPGATLFSGGADALAVQVRERLPLGDPLRRRLAGFFSPRPGRNSRYRRTRLPHAQVATRPTVLETLGAQLRHDGDGPLLVWVAGHGELGDRPAANGVQLWAGGRLLPTDFSRLLAGAGLRRTMTLIMTTCFSGGFAEVVFANADHKAGPARVLACGLFASPWDLESSGCDADPERRHHQGYARHFLPALRGLDSDSQPLPRGEIDFDGDGRISLYEAHTRVRIASESADVPTSTSERWLRHVAADDTTPEATAPDDAAPDAAAATAVAMAEEDAVIARLAARLRLSSDDLRRRPGEFARREAAIEVARKEVERVRVDEDATWHALAADLLGRWPTLDDPWHSQFEATLRDHGPAIGAHLEASPRWRRYREATRVTDAANRLLDRARIASALAERLERALDNRLMAQRLRAAGGEGWLRWQALLRCERQIPRLRPM